MTIIFFQICETKKIEYQKIFRNLRIDEIALYDTTNVYTSMQLTRSVLVYMRGWIQRKASDKSYYYCISLYY